MGELENLKLLSAARDYLKRLMDTVRYSQLFDETYAITSRLKNASRLQDKIVAKQAEGRNYTLASVTDIIGVRFISLYRQDIARNVRAMLEMVIGDVAVQPNALNGVELIELKSYTSNTMPEQDPVNLELQTLYYEGFAERFPGVPLELIPRGRYSSVHMVLKTEFKHEGTKHVLPIELQFRSVFEDAWAEIDHKLLYELGRFGESVNGQQREAMAQHLAVLKKMMDTAADYADVIRRTIVVSREKPVTIERNLDDAEYIRELAPLAGLTPEQTDQLATVLEEKAGIDDAIEAGRADVSALQYIDLANKLRALVPIVSPIPNAPNPGAARTILFSVRMEEALCRLLSGDTQQIRASGESYSSLLRDFPEFPAGWFRSAQAQQRLSEIGDPLGTEEAAAGEIAFAQYGKSLQLLEAATEGGQPDSILVSPAQASYINANAARLRGFAKWRLSDRRRKVRNGSEKEDLDDVLLAYEVSKEALLHESDNTDRTKLLNNVLFYAANAHEIAKELGVIGGLPDLTEMRQMLARLKIETDTNVLRLDTLVRANLVVGDPKAAALAAERILDINAEGSPATADAMSSPYVHEATERAARNAWVVIRTTGEA